MIHPSDEQLLAGIAGALTETVLPELARGSAARKQLQAAIEILRRLAFAGPGKAAALAADNADMAEVIRRMEAVLAERSPSPQPSPIKGEGAGKALQARLTELQENIPPDLIDQITPLLIGLHKRMTDRAIALIPPPLPRTPRTSP